MHSCYDINFLLKKPSNLLNRLLKNAHEKETENLIYDLWKSLYPKMISGEMEFIEYSAYKEKVIKKKDKFTNITYEEVENEMARVIAAYEGR